MAKRKKKRKLKGGVVKFLIIFPLVCALWVTALFIPVFNITNIKVSGVSVLKSEEVIKSSEIYKGQNLFRVSMKRAEKRLSQMPYVKDVKIKRKLPSGVEIIISEEKAAAYVVNGDNFVCINSDGKVLEITKKPKKGVMQILNLKIAKSNAGEAIEYKNVNFHDIQKRCIETIEENGLLERVAKLDFSNSSSIKLTLDNGLLAQLGGMGELDYKMKMINTVLAEGYSDGIFNIQNTEQPTYRKNE